MTCDCLRMHYHYKIINILGIEYNIDINHVNYLFKDVEDVELTCVDC